ncbi:phospholipase A-2-activating protein-like [Acanthaster planci]|uniref:Phospholipase A-2-activating protein-like n=1 Tax=Acanthaster planci TaxID=133434 RepID=A0A8B7Y804_ACAPL|nr:phospholipase A-2-activating protein-like [Acanthaster planci]
MAATMTDEIFKFSCNLEGHEMDVRAVAAAYSPNGSIITASRDRTARIWAPTGSGYEEKHCMRGHENFIAAVCVLPPNDKYPNGLIATGGNDHKINMYKPDSQVPEYTLSGHANTVCTLAAGKFGTLLSGSWDTTAKVWLNQRNVMTLKGHEAAIWAVALMPTQGLMLTGSADKTIKMWRAGKCEQTFVGHSDCVRALAIVSEVEFLSAANDSSIRRWLTTGDCTQQLQAHTSFIYSIALLPNGADFVTSGEDRTVRVWRQGVCCQTITLPAQSVWCVAALPNGDIVAGSSDGVARVFSTNPDRIASAEAQDLYNRQVAAFSMPAKAQAFGGIKMEDLPGKEDLAKPGTKDGQTKLIRVGDTVEAYSWSVADANWNKIGDVVGTEGDDTQPSSSKVMYEGKEYDYVFNVDLEEGKPALKLPYNITEDPWLTAQRFIHTHDLSQQFLEEIANFIIKNTKGVTLGVAAPPSAGDPFTGGSRYIPGSQPPPGIPRAGGDPTSPRTGSDPFTGAGRYIPTYGTSSQPSQIPSAAPQAKQPNPYFPKTSFVTFDTANAQAILGKLKDFNTALDESCQLDDASLGHLEQLLLNVGNSGSPTADQLSALWRALHLPVDKVFPAIDILRLVIRHPSVNQHFCNQTDGPQFISHILQLASETSTPANRMLVMRTFSNAFSHPHGTQLLAANREAVVSAALQCQGLANKNLHVAATTVLLNFAVALQGGGDIEARSHCLSAASTILDSESDPEALFRLLVAIGTLMSVDDNALAIAKSLDILPTIRKHCAVKDPAKVGDCAQKVVQMLL